MYKVFIYDKPILIGYNRENYPKNFQQLQFHHVDKILSLMQSADIEGIIFVNDDIEQTWNKFKNYFQLITAAGGRVVNRHGEYLVIYRLGKWDLPKGKMENGESEKSCALREVEEECGLSNLKIVKQLPNTYHVYPFSGTFALKTTYWFDMLYDGNEDLIPQTEEGIEEVKWVSKDDFLLLAKKTYPSLEAIFCLA